MFNMVIPTAALISGGIIIAILLVSKVLRSYIARSNYQQETIGLLLEFIATLELCAVSFEQGLFFEHHGKTAFALVLFFVCLWRCYHWSNVSTSPILFFESWLDGAISSSSMFKFIGIEIVAGALVYTCITKPIWSLGLSNYHTEKLYSYNWTPCYTHVQVDYLYAASTEMLCTLILATSFAYISTLNARMSNAVSAIIKSAIITGLVMAAFNISGGYMSPILASVLQFGCGGITPFQHVFVYWIGVGVGSLLATYSWKLVNGRS